MSLLIVHYVRAHFSIVKLQTGQIFWVQRSWTQQFFGFGWVLPTLCISFLNTPRNHQRSESLWIQRLHVFTHCTLCPSSLFHCKTPNWSNILSSEISDTHTPKTSPQNYYCLVNTVDTVSFRFVWLGLWDSTMMSWARDFYGENCF